MTVSGLIRSSVPGRTDRHPISVQENSYVFPADVVSGLGQGNTEAGGALLDKILAPHAEQGHRMVHTGTGSVPIVVAGGEYIAPPSTVYSAGGGDPARGHKVFDKMVTSVRHSTARRMSQLPGPRKD